MLKSFKRVKNAKMLMLIRYKIKLYIKIRYGDFSLKLEFKWIEKEFPISKFL